MRWSRWLWTIIPFFSMAAAKAAQPPAPTLDPHAHQASYYAMQQDPVTPHISWAKPYAGKRLRVLVIGPRWFQRETVELMERLDAECRPFLTFSSTDLYNKTPPGQGWGWQQSEGNKKEPVLADLHARLAQAWDVILIGHAPTRDFPPDETKALIAQVRAGSGFVWIRGEGDHDNDQDPGLVKALTQQVQAFPPEAVAALGMGEPWHELGALKISDTGKEWPERVRLSQLDRGRVCVVSYPSQTAILAPATGSDDLAYEYYLALAIKTILWAGQADPDVQFTEFPSSLAAEAKQLNCTVRSSSAPLSLRLQVQVRTNQELFQLPEQPYASLPGVQATAAVVKPVRDWAETIHVDGEAKLSLPLPTDLPTGNYIVDVRLADSAGKQVNWASTSWRVSRDVGIDRLAVSPEVLDLHTSSSLPMDAAVLLTRPLARVPAQVQLAVVDLQGRVLAAAQAVIPAGQPTVHAVLGVKGVRSSLLRVRAVVSIAGVPQAIAVTDVPVVHRPWPAFSFFSWGGSGPFYMDRQRARVESSLGIDALRGITNKDEWLTDMRSVPDVMRLAGTVDGKTQQVTPCFASPEYRSQLAGEVRDTVQSAGNHDPYVYLLGDDIRYTGGGLVGVSQNPADLQAFRRWLAAEYGSIEKLNVQWGAHYTSFEQVDPTGSRKDVLAAGKQIENYSSLIDQWLCNYWSYADIVRFVRDAVKECDPQAGIGISDPLWDWYFAGFDFAQMAPLCDFATPYTSSGGNNSVSDAIPDFLRPGSALGYTFGSYVDAPLLHPDYYRREVYNVLFHGGSNAFWYTDWNEEGGISPWLQPYSCLEATSKAIEEVRDGIGPLILGARRESGQIAVHYSIPSKLFSFLVEGTGSSWRLNDAWTQVCSLGYQPAMISTAQIENGDLDRYRALILPFSECITAGEARAIEQFVDAGGVVIADNRPGIADGHGRIDLSGPIPGLFGVGWSPDLLQCAAERMTASMVTLHDVQPQGALGGQSFTIPAPADVDVDPTLVVKEARAAASVSGAEEVRTPTKNAPAAGQTAAPPQVYNNVPLVTYRKVGKGMAICLNSRWGSDFALQALRAVLRAASIQPPVDPAPQTSVPNMQAAEFSDGAARYIGVQRIGKFDSSDNIPGDVALRTVSAGYLYDILSHRFLGKVTGTIRTVLKPDDVRLFAVLPSQVTGVRVTPAHGRCPVGQDISGIVAIGVQGGPAGRHVIHLQVIRPDGQRVRCLDQNLEITSGPAPFSLPLALNEPVGTWALLATDAATGVQGKATVKVASG